MKTTDLESCDLFKDVIIGQRGLVAPCLRGLSRWLLLLLLFLVYKREQVIHYNGYNYYVGRKNKYIHKYIWRKMEKWIRLRELS